MPRERCYRKDQGDDVLKWLWDLQAKASPIPSDLPPTMSFVQSRASLVRPGQNGSSGSGGLAGGAPADEVIVTQPSGIHAPGALAEKVQAAAAAAAAAAASAAASPPADSKRRRLSGKSADTASSAGDMVPSSAAVVPAATTASRKRVASQSPAAGTPREKASRGSESLEHYAEI